MKTGVYIGLGLLVIVGGWFTWQWWKKRNGQAQPFAVGKGSTTIVPGVTRKVDTTALMKEVIVKLNQAK